MKKWLSFLVALCLLVSVACCAAAETDDPAAESKVTEPAATAADMDYIGKWLVRYAKVNGVMTGASAVPLSMEFHADGTAAFVSPDHTENGSWAAAETGVTLTDAAGNTILFPYEDGLLAYDANGIILYFAKDEAAQPVCWIMFTEWKNTSIVMGNYVLDPAAVEQDFSITLKEDGTAVFHINGRDVDGKWEMIGGAYYLTDASGVTKKLTYADNTLNMEEDGVIMVFTPVNAQ